MHPSIKNSINKTRVLQEIRKKSGISRIEISKILQLDKSTISKITSDLLNQKLILDKKSDEDAKHAGRKRIGLNLNNHCGVVIGIDIQTEYYNTVVLDLNGEILLNYRELQPLYEFKETLKQIINDVLTKVEPTFHRILGIGIGIPGHIDPDNGIILQSNPLNIHSPINVYKLLEGETSYPLFIDNDANCCCWGASTYKRGSMDSNFLVALGEFRSINIQHKDIRSLIVGLGIVIGGKVLIGDTFSAGDFRSILKDETAVTQFSLNEDEATTIPEDRGKTIEVIKELLKHITLFTNTFNFSKILFAGVFNDYKRDIERLFQEYLIENWGYHTAPKVAIEFTTFGDYDVSYGAAGMFIEKLFTTPDISGFETVKDLKGMDLFNYVLSREAQ